MSAAKHTPGPWNIYPPYEDGDRGCLVRAKSCSVAEVIPHGDATEANARLIAAAPELLAACVALLNAGPAYNSQIDECECGEFQDYVPHHGQEKPRCIHTRAWSAISRAEGRS